MTVARRRRNSELTQAQGGPAGVPYKPEQLQPSRIAALGVLAHHQPAHAAHRKQIAIFAVRSRITLELTRRIPVSEDNRKQIAFVQGTTAAVAKFHTIVPSELLYPGERDVPWHGRARPGQQAG